MKRFAFGFGFETPQQRTSNRLHGWDDEDSAIIIIRAETADDARAWGREIAHESVRRLFEQASAEELPNWKDEQFAESIEEAAPDDVGVEVAVGEMPPIDWPAHE